MSLVLAQQFFFFKKVNSQEARLAFKKYVWWKSREENRNETIDCCYYWY